MAIWLTKSRGIAHYLNTRSSIFGNRYQKIFSSFSFYQNCNFYVTTPLNCENVRQFSSASFLKHSSVTRLSSRHFEAVGQHIDYADYDDDEVTIYVSTVCINWTDCNNFIIYINYKTA